VVYTRSLIRKPQMLVPKSKAQNSIQQPIEANTALSFFPYLTKKFFFGTVIPVNQRGDLMKLTCFLFALSLLMPLTFSASENNDGVKNLEEVIDVAPECLSHAQESVTKEPGAFIGNRNSKIYHYPNCKWVAMMDSGNKVWFSTPQEARSQGYVPCRECNPQ